MWQRLINGILVKHITQVWKHDANRTQIEIVKGKQRIRLNIEEFQAIAELVRNSEGNPINGH